MNCIRLFHIHWFFIGFFLLFPGLAVSEEAVQQEPSVAIQQSDKQTFFRGERVNFYIKIMSPGIFSGSPRFELPEIENGLLYQVQARPVLGTETVNGQSYASQLHEIWFFSQQSGDITIPEITVVFADSATATEEEKQYSKQTKAFNLNIKPLPDVPDNQFIIVTDSFTSSQDWNPKMSEGVAGDAVKRTISMQAKNMASIFLPDITIPKIAGVSIYRDPPVVLDRNERGEATAERKDTITYVFERQGEYVIPDITIQYWDSSTSKIAENILKGFTATIAVNPTRTEEATPVNETRKSIPVKLIALLAGLSLLLGFLFIKKQNQIRDYFRRIEEKRIQSEKAHFKRFKNACHRGNAIDAYNLLYLWAQKKYGHTDLHSIADSSPIGHGFQAEFEKLNTHLFKQKSTENKDNWNGASLYKSVRNLRKSTSQKGSKRTDVVNHGQLNY